MKRRLALAVLAVAAVSAAAAVGFLTHRTGNRIGAVLAAPDARRD